MDQAGCNQKEIEVSGAQEWKRIDDSGKYHIMALGHQQPQSNPRPTKLKRGKNEGREKEEGRENEI